MNTDVQVGKVRLSQNGDVEIGSIRAYDPENHK